MSNIFISYPWGTSNNIRHYLYLLVLGDIKILSIKKRSLKKALEISRLFRNLIKNESLNNIAISVYNGRFLKKQRKLAIVQAGKRRCFARD